MFPQIFGKYVLEREIAAGGMARVFLATLRGAVGFEKRLVVKQIRAELASDDAFVRRFVEEAKTSVELSHPNIVPVYELGVEHGVYYIAMELCEGLTLAEVLVETGPLDPEEGAYLGVEVCRALDYAHRRAGIIHRDVTPRNVLLDDEGAVRLIDFGIAAPANPLGGARSEIFGSPGHMPLEQLRGERLTPATDVFAVGALLIEAWTGRPPFRRSTAGESEKALVTPPEPLSIPRLLPLSGLVASTVEADPARRPASAEQLARPLREFLKSADLGDIARRLGERLRKTRRRAQQSNPWLTGSASSHPVGTPRTPVAPPGRTPSSTPAPANTAGSASMPSATRTFAAREEWTRKLPSVPPPATETEPPSQGSTQRIDAPIETSRPAASAPHSGSMRMRNDEDATPTTAPRAPPDSARAASNWRLIAVLLAGVVIAGVISVRFSGGAGEPPRLPLAQGSATVAPPVPELPPALPPEVPAGPAPSSTAAVKSAAQAKPASPVKSAETTLPREGTCSVMLLANVAATTAQLDGRSVPLNQAIPAACGPHSVKFQNQTLNEVLPGSFELVPGSPRRVMADFTSADARVVVVQ